MSHLISLSKFNLPLIGTFTWPTPPGPYRVTTCRGGELNYGSHTYFFDHTRTWSASSAERSAQCTHSAIPTRRIWNDDYDGQMVFGDLGGLKFPDICLTGEEKPRKNLTQETCPYRRSNPGPLRARCACYRLLHSGGLSIHSILKINLIFSSTLYNTQIVLETESYTLVYCPIWVFDFSEVISSNV